MSSGSHLTVSLKIHLTSNHISRPLLWHRQKIMALSLSILKIRNICSISKFFLIDNRCVFHLLLLICVTLFHITSLQHLGLTIRSCNFLRSAVQWKLFFTTKSDYQKTEEPAQIVEEIFLNARGFLKLLNHPSRNVHL